MYLNFNAFVAQVTFIYLNSHNHMFKAFKIKNRGRMWSGGNQKVQTREMDIDPNRTTLQSELNFHTGMSESKICAPYTRLMSYIECLSITIGGISHM